MTPPLTGSLLTPGAAPQAWRTENFGIVGDAPLVSCLMVSRGQLFPARFAVECFRAQSYPNRELVVVLDQADCPLATHIEALGDPRIRVIRPAGEAQTLGELRNLSVAAARGSYVCNWDDDDLYDPERLRLQLGALLAADADACLLRRLALWWPRKRRLAKSGIRLWEGSILAKKETMVAYPAIRRNEDAEMIEVLRTRARIVHLDAPDLYVYVRHGGNTFGATHFARLYHASPTRWVHDAYDARLRTLAQRLPIRAYLDAAGALHHDAAPAAEDKAGRAPPLVSIIVRSMGRPELRLALESLSRQAYPQLDVIVVDATGGAHPPLPEIAWREGHRVRLVAAGRRLPRPQACNAGIDAVHGDWFGFLDDDDTCDPDHIADLIAAAAGQPDALVVYGPARLLDAEGEVKNLFGVDFNRAVMFHGPLFYWQAALIRRSVLDLGCRFDERLDVCEDRDFLAQIAAHGRFAFIPAAIGFNYRPDLGTSGTGQGANRDLAKRFRYDMLLQAKWSGSGLYHSRRAFRLCQQALRAYALGDRSAAEALFGAALADYPDDPNALNGRGYLRFEGGDIEAAEADFRRAIQINTGAGEYHLNLARLLQASGRSASARAEARAAAGDARVRAAVLAQFGELGDPPRAAADAIEQRSAVAAPPSRTSPCPCGSGKRYKHCCGQASAPQAAPLGEADAAARRALDARQVGDADAAAAILAAIAPDDLHDRATTMACGRLGSELGLYETAYALFRRAEALGEANTIGDAMADCCEGWYGEEREASLRQTLRERAAALRAEGGPTGEPAVATTLHIIADFGRAGSHSARHALDLLRTLPAGTTTRLWSVSPPALQYQRKLPLTVIDDARGAVPTDGHLVFAGSDFDFGLWLAGCRAERVTVRCDSNRLETLLDRLIELEDLPPVVRVAFSHPSRQAMESSGLEGRVEYPLIDATAFRPTRPRNTGRGPLVIGRHTGDRSARFHPNDPTLFRRLVGAGHAIRVLGGDGLAPAIGRHPLDGAITLLDAAGVDASAFLEGLDCFLLRHHPRHPGIATASLLEAMAMALPVVVFADRSGIAELIEDGRNGFLVHSEAEALERIGRLADDPALRTTLGSAARQTVVQVMDRQLAELTAAYLDGVPASARPVAASGMAEQHV